jgi:hypothetical protein
MFEDKVGPLTLMGICNFMNNNYKVKRSGEPFNISDVQGYVRREAIPTYFKPSYRIERINSIYNNTPTYNLIQVKNN